MRLLKTLISRFFKDSNLDLLDEIESDLSNGSYVPPKNALQPPKEEPDNFRILKKGHIILNPQPREFKTKCYSCNTGFTCTREYLAKKYKPPMIGQIWYSRDFFFLICPTCKSSVTLPIICHMAYENGYRKTGYNNITITEEYWGDDSTDYEI